MIKVNDKIKVHIFGCDNKEIKMRNSNTVFTVYKKNNKLGIDWNTDTNSFGYKFHNDSFVSLEEFSHTVIFENVETGEKFHFSNLKNEIVRVEL